MASVGSPTILDEQTIDFAASASLHPVEHHGMVLVIAAKVVS